MSEPLIPAVAPPPLAPKRRFVRAWARLMRTLGITLVIHLYGTDAARRRIRALHKGN